MNRATTKISSGSFQNREVNKKVDASKTIYILITNQCEQTIAKFYMNYPTCKPTDDSSWMVSSLWVDFRQDPKNVLASTAKSSNVLESDLNLFLVELNQDIRYI